MSPVLERLIELQRLDSAIAEARARIAVHSLRVAEQDALVAEANAILDAARQRLKDSHTARSESEKSAALYQGRLSKFKDQLAAVKTNREYTAMQHEIETAQAELGAAEEKVLERMMESDAISAEIKHAEADLASRRTATELAKKSLSDDLVTVQATLETALGARASVVGMIDPSAMAVFNLVAKNRKGIALGTATRDGLCSLCHVRLRPQVFQIVRQNDQIVQCDSCQRILYYVPPPPPVDPPVVRG